MSVIVHHHPFTRAATVVWMLEEVGVPHTLQYVDLSKGAQKSPEFLALNPMGKLASMEQAVSRGDFLLGDRFSMVDVIFGGAIRYMLRFGMVSASPGFTAYPERLVARPALQRAEARNLEIGKAHGLA